MSAVLLAKPISEYLHVFLMTDIEVGPGGQPLLNIIDDRVL